MSEEKLQEQVADYLRLQYPNVLFHSDYGSGVKLTARQAAVQKRQNAGRRGWPDLMIAQIKRWVPYQAGGPRLLIKYEQYATYGDHIYELNCEELIIHGLYIELKKDGENIYAKRNLEDPSKLSLDGKVYVDQHTREQADVLYRLRRAGYCAEFAIGFDEAKCIIDQYLKES